MEPPQFPGRFSSLLAGNPLSRSSRTMRGDPQALFSSVLMA
jgi:hypothetical protein